MRNCLHVLSLVAAFALTAPAARAQDADQPAEVDARELLGDRASPPDMREDGPPEVQSGDNAGMMRGSVTSSGSSREETVTETRSSTISFGAAPETAPAPWAPPPGWGPTAGWRPRHHGGGGGGGGGAAGGGGGGASDLAGDWTLLVAGAGSCKITLTDTPWWGGYKAQTRGCDKDFFMVGRWAGGGSEIQFTDAFDKVAGQLRRTGPDRFQGSRGSDGAQISLVR